MYNIRTYSTVTGAGLKSFNENKYTISDKCENPDAIIVHSTPLHDLVFNKELLSICRVGAGFNTIPIERCTEAGICVFNTPGGNANAVKELVVAALIMLVRNGFESMKWVGGLNEEEIAYGKTVEKGKAAFRGTEIMGKKIGVIGTGNIGYRVAKAFHDLGLEVIGFDPYLPHLRRLELSSYIHFVDDVTEIYKESDIVTIHTPLDDTTKNYITKKEIDMMKDGVFIINYARGPLVNDEAICEALASGKVAGYATDFPTANQVKQTNILYTPHLGAGTPQADENCSIMAAKQTMDYIENGNIVNSVNLPSVSFARADGDRITIIHENKVGMLGKFTEIVSSLNINIENLVNKAKGAVAYTILDFNGEVEQSVIESIAKIDGVIRVRLIK